MYSLLRFLLNGSKVENFIFGSPRSMLSSNTIPAEMDTTGYIHMRFRVQGCVAWTEQSGVALSILGVHQHMPLSLGMENCSLSCVDTDFAPLPLSASTALNSGAGDCFHQVERSQGLSQQEEDFLVSEKNRNPE